ncbi:hypothetical protein [uncultured Methanobrevibacter sp.]|uniref:hypothetical protein n=1 Tax=uncultured Methanobrevibacter sp. TaxID=253161 RepID=UPI0025CC50F3|nr:hypothetical protein [uncultured Methanobrevibacter sp.]
MVSQNIINIILKMEDQATSVAQKADQMIKKFGNSAQSSNNKASQAAQQTSQKMNDLTSNIEKVVDEYIEVGNKGKDSFNKLSQSQQQAVVQFHKLDDEAQTTLMAIRELGRGFGGNLTYETTALINRFNELTVETNTWKGSLDYAKNKLNMLGTSTDTLKGKLQVVGSAITTYVGTKWDTIKGKVSNVASHIKSTLTNALSTVKTKIQSLGDAFSGVGGIISSVFGGIGLAAMSDMTIGASISRERIQHLSSALLGAGQSTEKFNQLWNKMDDDTNKSLVSLDQLAQSLSVVKQMTGATGDQLNSFESILLDIGQRAILMGKSGDEAMGLMQAAGKGLNGEFEMLKENFGITKEKLENAGWSGSADDIDGYTKALEDCLKQSGDVSSMMDTTHGKITRLKKMWSVSARSLGDEFKPMVDDALDSVLKFVDANNDGKVDEGAKNWMKYAAGAMTAASAFATMAPSISPVLQVLGQLWNSAAWVKDKLSNLEETIQNMQGKWDSFKEKVNSAKEKLQELKDKLSTSWNEGKLNTIKQKFQEIKDKIVDAKGNLVDFLSKMRENAADKLEILKTKFSELKDKILLAKDKLIDLLSKIREIAAEKIATLADKFRSLADGISLAGIKAKLYAAYQWLVNAATAVWNALLDANPVMIIVIAIMALVAALIYLYNTNDTVRAAIDGLFAALASVGEWLMGSLVPAFEWLWQTLQPLGEFLMSVFAPIWDVIVQVLTIVWTTMVGIIGVFDQFKTGQIDLPALLLGIWGLLSQMWIQIMMVIANAILNFAGQVWNYAVSAGTNFLNGVVNYISQLPGRVWDFLVQTTSNIISAGGQWVDNARQKAGEMVNGAATTVQELPGKIYDEFIKVPDRIREAIPQAIAAALNFGKDIINGVLDAMGIHSPGIAQNSIGEEFKGVVTKIKDTIKPAGEYARQVGEAIVDKFGEPKLSMDTEDLMPYQDLDANPLENVDMADIDLSSISGGLDSAMGMTDDTNTMIGESYNALATMMMTTLNNMVLQDQLAYGAIQTNDLTTFQNISTGLNLNLLSMSTNLRTQLNNMLMTHRAAMNNATNTTRQQLAQMLSETMKVTGEMRSAWAVMADSIISAAARIRNEAAAYFDQLSSTIGTFYRKLQNPSQWAGGDTNGTPSTVRHTGRDPAVMHRLTRGVANTIRRDNQLPYTITATKAQQNGIIDPLTLEYMNKTSSSRLNVLDLLQSGICPNCVAGSWDGVVDPNVTYIKNTAREWQMRGPAIHTGVGDIDTGLSFKVSDFESGTPHISWGSFVRIATAIASAIPYDYYYNSDKYGSWQNAIAHGAWNCFDGASAMVALANACGYGGYVNCGLNWGSDGHCCAIINGYTFDTTALKQRGGWTAGPCNYSHPAPSAGGINIKIPNRGGINPRRNTNPLEGLFDNKDDASNVEEVKLILEHNVNVNVDGKTEDVDTDSLIKMLTEKISDKNVINKIADALIKRDKRIARMGGV